VSAWAQRREDNLSVPVAPDIYVAGRWATAQSGGDLWVMAAHSHHHPGLGDTGINSESIPASTTDAPRLVFPWLSVTSSRRPLSAVKACQCRPRSHHALVSCIVLPSPFASQIRFLCPSSSTLKDVKPFSSPMSPIYCTARSLLLFEDSCVNPPLYNTLACNRPVSRLRYLSFSFSTLGIDHP